MKVTVCDRCLRVVDYDLIPVTIGIGTSLTEMGVCKQCKKDLATLQKKYHFDGDPMVLRVRGLPGVTKSRKRKTSKKVTESEVKNSRKTKKKVERPKGQDSAAPTGNPRKPSAPVLPS